ncbi:ATP-dependent nuclease [Actinokineospora sp. 24-640]
MVTVEVEGIFVLDDWEKASWTLPDTVAARRRWADGRHVYEVSTMAPVDERFRRLDAMSAQDLKAMVDEFELKPERRQKAACIAVLKEHIATLAMEQAWVAPPAGFEQRLPVPLVFDDGPQAPSNAVRTALMSRFNEYMKEPEFVSRVEQLESEFADRIRRDAKGLCDHIQAQCDDLGAIRIEPKVSIKQAFTEATLSVTRPSGAVGIERLGRGSSRRVLLAVWQWTSNLLREDENTSSDLTAPSVAGELPPRQTIVVYDEPDTHLDYAHQRRVMRLVHEQCALEHVNVVVATHSMNLIDGVDISDIVHLKLDRGRTVVERLLEDTHASVDEHLGAIATSVGLRNSVLLHERCFLVVEGESEYRAFPVLFRLSQGIPLQSAGIALWACGGNIGALELAKYLHERDRTIMLAIDHDSLTQKPFKDKQLTKAFGATWRERVEFIGDDTTPELEAVFPDETWALAANRAWPRRDDDWTEEHFAALRGTGKFSEKVFSLLVQASDSPPSGKPAVMFDLANALTHRGQIPEEVTSVFDRARDLAEP